MQDVGDEVDHPVWSKLGDRLELDPLGELIDSHKNMSKTSWCHCEGPNHVEAPASERLGRRYSDEGVGQHMSLLTEELAVLTSSHQIFGVGHGGGPPETGSVCFADQ
jgi:hypothetical protein